MSDTRYWGVDYFWIDAICINQYGLKERSAQVSIIGDIYRIAWYVIVWMGPDEKGVGDTIRVCQLLAPVPNDMRSNPGPIDDNNTYIKLGIDRVLQEQWLGFSALLQRRWSSLAWTLQELIWPVMRGYYAANTRYAGVSLHAALNSWPSVGGIRSSNDHPVIKRIEVQYQRQAFGSQDVDSSP